MHVDLANRLRRERQIAIAQKREIA